jgi:hypothetical protein
VLYAPKQYTIIKARAAVSLPTEIKVLDASGFKPPAATEQGNRLFRLASATPSRRTVDLLTFSPRHTIAGLAYAIILVVRNP